MRLNQDSAGAAEELEHMMNQIEEGKRDLQYEAEKSGILMQFVTMMSKSVFELSNNEALLTEIALDRQTLEESLQQSRNMDEGDALLMPELLLKKRELRRKLVLEKAMKTFTQLCRNRGELIVFELKKMQDVGEQMRQSLDEAENKIDSDQLHIRTVEAELAKLRLTVEVGKTNLARSEKSLVSLFAQNLTVRIVY